MAKILMLWVIFSVVSSGLTAQNLVTNPSFEEHIYTECVPTQNSLAFSSYATDWSCPNWGTSDVFSSSGELPSSCPSSMPNDGSFPPYIGTQMPRTGDRLAGIIYRTSNRTLEEDISYTWREYIQAKLTEPLVPGEYYKFEMYVSLAEESAMASNNVGVAFAEEQQYFEIYSILPLAPVYTEKRIITDTLNWTRIVFSFKASAPFQYLIIGNYYYDSQTNYIPASSPNSEIKTSYYFIDDVSLENIPCSNFDFTGDFTICPGDSAIVTAATNYDNIIWTTLSDPETIINTGTTLKAKLDETTSYRITGIVSVLLLAWILSRYL